MSGDYSEEVCEVHAFMTLDSHGDSQKQRKALKDKESQWVKILDNWAVQSKRRGKVCYYFLSHVILLNPDASFI